MRTLRPQGRRNMRRLMPAGRPSRRRGLLERGDRRASGLALLGAGAAGGWLASNLDRRRRHIARDRAAAAVRRRAASADRRARYAAGIARGVAHEATTAFRHDGREYDDVTLARKVESEIFRGTDAPKGSVSVNVGNGVVELRGRVDHLEHIEALGDAAARVDGVKDVHNLLHTPDSPPRHSPAGDSTDVGARAGRMGARWRFTRHRATAPSDEESATHTQPS
jgi:hypothetical protein